MPGVLKICEGRSCTSDRSRRSSRWCCHNSSCFDLIPVSWANIRWRWHHAKWLPVDVQFFNAIVDILAKFNISVCGTATFVLVRRNVDPGIFVYILFLKEKRVLILQLISSFRLIIFWYLKPSRLERQSLVTNTSAPFLSITWIWIVTISKLASVWKSKVCRQSCAQDHMNNRIPWHTYHYIGDTSGPSTTCKFVINMQSNLNSLSFSQGVGLFLPIVKVI